MTEIMEKVKLTAAQQNYILHWGEMGTKWGINRTVAQTHALLFISPEPLNAEQIGGTLGVARSNVSNSLRELVGWGIVRRVHVLGDRRDHFESLKDVWEMFRIILDERKKREIDPTLAMLDECLREAKKEKGAGSRYTAERLRELHEFMSITSRWYGQISRWPTKALIPFLKTGDGILNLISRKKKTEETK